MFRRRPPTQRIDRMEQLVSAISDLTDAVRDLVAVEQQVLDHINQPAAPAGTVLAADDQVALDAAVSTVRSVASTLTAALPPPPPPSAPEPAPAAEPSGT